MSDDPLEPEPHTPNHFLRGGHQDGSTREALPQTEQQLQQEWRSLRVASSIFWHRLVGEYISNLPPTVRQHSPSKVTMRIGSLVLIRPDGYTPRLQWPLATIEGLHPGADERVRTVTLRTSKGLAKRPVQRLHLLEMAEPPRTVEMIAGAD